MPMIATNAFTMKEKNQRLLTKLILSHSYSRAELAEHTSLTKAGVSVIVEELMTAGIVREAKRERSQVGRRPIRLSVNPDFMYAIGINLTRRYTEVGLVNVGGTVLTERRLEALPPEETFARLREEIRRILDESGIDRQRLYGVGISAPGPLDPRSATILKPPAFEAWHGRAVGEPLERMLEKPCFLENISGALALCEKYFGNAKEESDFLLLTVTEGIGSGLVIGDRLSRGTTEIGHTSIHYHGRPCKCGNLGCVECYASIPAILEGTPYRSWEEVLAADDRALIAKEADYLACAIVNAVNTLGLRHVILDGEITKSPERLIGLMEERLARNSITGTPPHVTVSSSFSPVLCAATSAFDAYFSFT